MNENVISSAAHFRAFPRLLLEGPLKYGGKTLFHNLICLGARRFRAGWCHGISISLDPDGTMTVVLHGEILPPAEMEQLTQDECGELNEAQLCLLKIIAFSSAVEFHFRMNRGNKAAFCVSARENSFPVIWIGRSIGGLPR